MNFEMKTFNNPEFGEIRTVEMDGGIWFVGKDAATALGYADTKSAISDHVDAEDKTVIQRGQNAAFEIPNRGLTVINESGLYSLVISSKLPTAKKFKRWVTSEILPSIRKTGSYRSLPVSPAEQLLAQAQLMVEQERRLKAVEEKTQATQETVQSAFSALSHPTVSRDHWQDETRSQIRRMCLENGLNYQTHTAKLYEELESEAHVNLETRVKRLRDRMKTGGAKYAERQAVNKLTVIAQDPKLRSIFSSVIQRRYAQLVTEKLSAM